VMSKGVAVDHPDVNAIATWDGKQLTAMVWNYADDDIARPAADVTLDLSGLKLPDGNATVEIRRVDSEHGDAYSAWKKMGAPEKPTAEQIAELHKTATVVPETATVVVAAGKATLHVVVPDQGVVLVTVH
jgi:xylan 1,4-beta-xylosidase